MKGRPEWAAFSFSRRQSVTGDVGGGPTRVNFTGNPWHEVGSTSSSRKLLASLTIIRASTHRAPMISMLRANLIGRHDARHVRIEPSFPHDLAGRNIFVAVHQRRDVIAAAQHLIETNHHSQRPARISGQPVSVQQTRDVQRRRRRLKGSGRRRRHRGARRLLERRRTAGGSHPCEEKRQRCKLRRSKFVSGGGSDAA